MSRLPVLAAILALLLCPFGAAVARDTTPGNETIDFARFGQWEVWCIRLVKSGEVVCDLNVVLNYVPNPNFRALIPRVYLDGQGRPFVEIELEWQTSLERGWFEVPGQPRFDFAGCGSPCRLAGERGVALIALLSRGGAGTLRLYDFVVEPHDVAVALDGFAEGLVALEAMAATYRD